MVYLPTENRTREPSFYDYASKRFAFIVEDVMSSGTNIACDRRERFITHRDNVNEIRAADETYK
jgi:hypothetical protein